MHLTKIELDLHRRFARKLLSSPQVMHAVVMKACQPGGESGQSDATDGFPPGRVLWRVDSGSFGVSLYILSPSPPGTDTAGIRGRPQRHGPHIGL